MLIARDTKGNCNGISMTFYCSSYHWKKSLFFGCAHTIQKFLGQGLKLCRSSDQSHYSNNVGSFYCWAIREIPKFVFFWHLLSFLLDLPGHHPLHPEKRFKVSLALSRPHEQDYSRTTACFVTSKIHVKRKFCYSSCKTSKMTDVDQKTWEGKGVEGTKTWTQFFFCEDLF